MPVNSGTNSNEMLYNGKVPLNEIPALALNCAKSEAGCPFLSLAILEITVGNILCSQ